MVASISPHYLKTNKRKYFSCIVSTYISHAITSKPVTMICKRYKYLYCAGLEPATQRRKLIYFLVKKKPSQKRLQGPQLLTLNEIYQRVQNNNYVLAIVFFGDIQSESRDLQLSGVISRGQRWQVPRTCHIIDSILIYICTIKLLCIVHALWSMMIPLWKIFFDNHRVLVTDFGDMECIVEFDVQRFAGLARNSEIQF